MKKKIIVSSVAVFFVIGLILLTYLLLNLFHLKKVYIIAEKLRMDGLSEMNGQNLLFLNTDKIAEILVHKNINLKSIKIDKIYPDSLKLYPQAKIIKARIKSNTGEVLLDEEFILLRSEDGEVNNVPVVEVQNIPLVLSQKADWRVERAIIFYDQIINQGLSIGRIKVDGYLSYVTLSIAEGTEVLIPLEAEGYKAAASLQIIMSRFRIEGKFVSRIDLQFDKPVVILESGEKISSME